VVADARAEDALLLVLEDAHARYAGQRRHVRGVVLRAGGVVVGGQ
jgi:hypothetical protein